MIIVCSLVLFRRHDLLCSDDMIRGLYPTTVFCDDIIIIDDDDDDDDCHSDVIRMIMNDTSLELAVLQPVWERPSLPLPLPPNTMTE